MGKILAKDDDCTHSDVPLILFVILYTFLFIAIVLMLIYHCFEKKRIVIPIVSYVSRLKPKAKRTKVNTSLLITSSSN